MSYMLVRTDGQGGPRTFFPGDLTYSAGCIPAEEWQASQSDQLSTNSPAIEASLAAALAEKYDFLVAEINGKFRALDLENQSFRKEPQDNKVELKKC